MNDPVPSAPAIPDPQPALLSADRMLVRGMLWCIDTQQLWVPGSTFRKWTEACEG